MSTESSLHSNALNFMSLMESGVDTRTGQYTLSIALPELGANYFQGPDVPLTITFNPLNIIDSGWGKGWNLLLTQFTEHNQVITTHSGETFKVTGTSGDRLYMPEQKLPHFHFYREPAGPGGNARYRVVHRSGMVEILEVMGSLLGRIALPVEVYSPTGHRLNFAYKPFNAAYMMLSTITDGRGQILLEVERANGSIELRERPYEGGDGQPVARYVMNLVNGDWVKSIVLPTPEQASWRLEYRQVLGHLCLEKIETPTGAREYLQYRDGGHLFPAGSRRDPLPRVTRHIVEPGLGQPSFMSDYTYPNSANFLGHGIQVPWADDGRDNLYKHTGNYEYKSVETLCDADAKPLRSITRTFNRFHLLTSTRTVQNESVHEASTTYNLRDVPFDQQPPTLQLPIKEQTRWSKTYDVTRSRLETVETTYDTHGNVTLRKLANGVTETSTWYSTEEQDGYPGDANGFVRHLKSKTTTPASTGKGAAPTLTHHYRYSALPPLAGNATKLNPMVVEHSETLVQQGNEAQPLEHTTYSYIDAPSASLLHGRRYQQVVKRNKLETTTQYQFTAMVDPLSLHPTLQTIETLIGYDGTTQSTLQRRSLLLGETLFERDQSGVETQRDFDVLRRTTCEKVSPGTRYEASRHYVYSLCAADGDIASQQVKNARGVSTLTELDGLGRPVTEKRDNVLEARPGMFVEISAFKYDALGNSVETTSTDWLQGSKSLTLTTRFQYDDWGEQSCTIGPDGVEEHNVLCPIGTPTHKGPIRRTWREGGELKTRTVVVSRHGKKAKFTQKARAVSARTETWLNLFDKPVLRKRLNALGELLAERSYRYDGLGRTLEEKDERGHSTTFSYDAWGRMLGTHLPDNTQLTRTYAAHASDDLPASLVVKPANVLQPARQIGAQYHDGLNRLMGATTGNRTEYFLFRDGEPMPRQRISPAGETLELDYNLQLTNEPISSDAPDDRASFNYHDSSARLLSCNNRQGKRRFDYNIANQLVAEHWDDNGSGKTWSRTHLSTLHDRLMTTTEANGVKTEHSYDDATGRLSSTRQGLMQASFTYDDLGLVSHISSHDLSTGNVVETAITYDDQDREDKRTWRQAGHAERTQEQVWGDDDLLQSRHLKAAAVSLLQEGFGYDKRSRLVTHTCTGLELPQDPQGRSITRQTFTFDAYDNISVTLTMFAGGPRPEQARFTYAESDPCQLQRVEYNPPRTEPNPRLTYDKNGNLTRDERGRPARYDSQNRLLGLNQAGDPDSYGHDANGLLITALQAGKPTLLLHDGLQLRMAVRDGLETLFLHQGEQPLGQQQSGVGAQPPVLLHTSASHSVVAESQAGSLGAIRYSAYGERHTDGPAHSALGYNGEALDPDSGWYLLGNGYRAYNPALMRFNSPDALSPFGEGGLNYYGYCQGNPVTFRDPTGHYSIGNTGQTRSLEDLARNQSSRGFRPDAMFWTSTGISAAAILLGLVAAAALLAPPLAAIGLTVATPTMTLSAAMNATATAVGMSTTAMLVGAAVGATAAGLGTAGFIISTEATLSGSQDRQGIAAALGIAATIVGLPLMVAGTFQLAKTAVKAIMEVSRNAQATASAAATVSATPAAFAAVNTHGVPTAIPRISASAVFLRAKGFNIPSTRL
ncbi:sugar-binding protein [Pseudomonas putida]|nr:sugar-binding protein [Pseudomonas putida]